MPRGHPKTLEQVQEEFRALGAEPLFTQFIPRSKLLFRCSCGTEHQVRSDAYLGRSLLCPACAKLKFKKDRSISLEQVQQEFQALGSKILIWNGYHESCTFTCSNPKCDQTSTIKYNNFKSGFGRKLLCPTCYKNQCYKRGEDHPWFNPKLTKEHRERTQKRPSEIGQWYRTVLKNHKYTCVLSGIVGRKLAAHHLFNYATYPQVSLLDLNGVCITKDLHIEFHKIYGKINNTAEQFIDFARSKGIDWSPPTELLAAVDKNSRI